MLDPPTIRHVPFPPPVSEDAPIWNQPIGKKPALSDDDHHAQRPTTNDQQPSEPEPDQTPIEQEKNDNAVDWDGPDYPHHPRNWPEWKRMTQVVLASAFLLTA
ncbi:MFS general substrate transporter [Fusarium austroafricanum]|uniref:MFS general substrate transporter n=1 Tax=Fusarium austroafricanum TaxID=2364996 RepID=A0A8H4KCG4_9HYPO|nr:MFS general substrate transporter [Fusarium austroafricanum]